ncbi:cyclic di-3',5'-guanylate-activated glycosyltransferase NrfB [Escherichia coli]
MSEGPGGPQGATAGGTLAMRMLSQQAMVASQMKRAANDKAIAQMLASKKSGPPAARLGDEIQHKSFLGALAGAVLGAIVTIAEGCLIMAACATGPYALVLVPALMYASYKASDYVEEKQNQLESWINSFCDTDGAINTGSENVKINGKPAARAAVTLPPPPPPGAIPEVPQGEPSWGDIATDLLESAAEKAVPLAKAWGNAVITLTDSNAGFMDRVSAGASLLFPAGPVLMEFATMVGGRGEIKKDVDFPEAGEDTALCDKENKPPRIRRIKRKLSVYRRYPRMSYRELYKPDEKPLAIMVPAWNETGVIGNMAELAATTLDYENYHIFVGTYPNDPDTQRDVDEVCARFPNVHKVVCARPGPTSKADCLNNVLDAITQFERSANFAFAGFILHDAEDVISPMELRLFNYLVERKDLIQIPVYPFEREWTHFTSMTYIDEFSELHGKDVPVREALAGQVPSAGVGTCFSRRAVTALLADGDGIAFDVQSLTEDYDIGFRLKEKGMTEIFVRFPVVDEAKEREQRKFLQHARTSNMICVREYFPDTFSTAVRQKSRWIIGIVFQGFKTHKWTSSLTLNYFLWRDRKGAISNFVSFLAMLVMLQLLLLLAYESLWPNAWHFLSIFSGSAWLMTLLWLNFGLMVNRIVQRVIFVTGYYGLKQGLLSVLRLFWGNLINFMANWRALKQVLQHGDPRRVAWDKTTHDFPSVTGDTRSLRPLGQILLENQVITEEQLDTALRNRVEGLRLGGSMLMQGLISAEQLAQALAEQNGVAWESIDAWQIPSSLIAEMPASVALHYAVLPLRLENDELIVGSEDGIDPVSLAALTRKVGRKVRYVIVLRGQIVTGLRHWYARRRGHDPRAMLYNAVQHQWLTEQQTGEIWRQYVPHQFLFAEILTTLGHINRSAINVLLLRHERSSLPLGKFLVTEGVISQETLDRVLTIQRELQVSMQSLLLKAGLNTEQVAQLESENEGE